MPRQKYRKPWLDYLVYAMVRSIVAFAQMLSIEQAYALARFLGWILYLADKRHRAVGLENLKFAYGDSMSEAERDEVIRGVYRHFCMMLMEILHLPRKLHWTNWREYFVLEGHGRLLDEFMSRQRPLIFVTGHYGNWEMAGYVFGMFGFPTVAVARTLDNPYLERYLRTFREKTGQELVPKTGGFDQMVEVLQSNRALSFLADQDAGQRGLYVEFFGRPASTHKAIALLALEHQALVIVGVARRIGPGFRYEFFCADVIDTAELKGVDDPVRVLTQRYTAALESLIRQDPSQYLWLHRRWKHQPQPPRKKAAEATSQVEHPA